MFFCFRSTNRTGRWFRQQFTTSVRWDGWDKRRHKLCRINTILRGLITKCTAIKLYSGCTVAWAGLQLAYLRTFIVQHPLFCGCFTFTQTKAAAHAVRSFILAYVKLYNYLRNRTPGSLQMKFVSPMPDAQPEVCLHSCWKTSTLHHYQITLCLQCSSE